MLITQLLLSAPATEKFITICPGLDRAVSIDMFVSLSSSREPQHCSRARCCVQQELMWL